MQPQTTYADILVIGAGISGLIAAQTLRNANKFLKIIVLESRDRIGGRVVTNSSLHVPLDLGAGWVHGLEGTPLLELFGNNPLQELHKTSEDNFWTSVASPNETLLDNGDELSKDEVAKYGDTFNEFLSHLCQLAINISTPQISAEEGVRLILTKYPTKFFVTEREKKLFRWYLFKLEVWMSTRLSDITLRELGCRDINMGAHPGAHCVVKKGFGPFVSKLAEGLDIRLKHGVYQVDWSRPDLVRVFTSSGNYCSRYLLSTLPLGVLKKRVDSLFYPQLSRNKLESLTKMKMGYYGKVILQFDRVFWSSSSDSANKTFIGKLSSEPTTDFALFLDYSKVKGVPILVAFMIGNHCMEMEKLPKKEVVNKVLKQLRTMYPAQDVPDPINFIITEWNTDPHSMGAYSYLPLGATEQDVREIGSPEGNRLFFAGEATDFDGIGTVHGAWNSGKREAIRILNLINTNVRDILPPKDIMPQLATVSSRL